MLIDSHCHLSFKDYGEGEIEGILIRAAENDVSFMINIGAGEGFEGNPAAVELARHYPQIFATVGIHPHDAKLVTQPVILTEGKNLPRSLGRSFATAQDDTFSGQDILRRIEKLAQDEKVVAIGEIGLDFHYDHSPRDVQERVLEQFLELAGRVEKPVAIHDRDAGERTYEIIKSHFGGLSSPPRAGSFSGDPALDSRPRNLRKAGMTAFSTIPAVIHCFTGTKELAKKYLDLGCLISFSGIVTFKKAADLHEVVRFVPIERMLVETDSPFLAPEPHRGKKNEPAHVKLVAEQVARLKGLNFEDVARITTLNAKRFFNLPLPNLVASIAYAIRDSLYLNITNKCTLACTFCPKFVDFEVKGYYLRLPKEPTVEEIIQKIGDAARYHEVVFCGYGEPTKRLDALKEISTRLKQKYPPIKLRLNTDGLGNLVHQRNILPELAPFIDSVSVSLNAADPQTYAKYCPSKYGEAAYPAVLEFIREATRQIKEVTATVVGMPGINVEACRKIAEEELKAQFRFRPYNEVG